MLPICVQRTFIDKTRSGYNNKYTLANLAIQTKTDLQITNHHLQQLLTQIQLKHTNKNKRNQNQNQDQH